MTVLLGPVRCAGCGQPVAWGTAPTEPRTGYRRWRDPETMRIHRCPARYTERASADAIQRGGSGDGTSRPRRRLVP